MGEESRLIEQALNGNIEAWGEIVQRYKGAVYGVALGIVGNRADAEDAAQDAFIRAYENLRRYDRERKFSTWIFTITANLCKNMLRRGKFQTRLDETLEQTGDMDDPEEAVARDERQTLVQDALAALDEKYRSPVVLRFYGDLDYQEIAQVLDLPEGTVKTRIHRAKEALKDWMTQRGVKGNA